MPTVFITWPHRRVASERATRTNPDAREQMDGLSHLDALGIRTRVIHPFPYPLNPLARRGTVLAGLDVLRFFRLLLCYRKFDALVSIADSSCLLFMLTKRLFRLSKPILVIDPALSDGYPFRKRLQDMVLPYADKVLVLGTEQLRYLERAFAKRVNASFIYFRMDTRFFDPARAGSGSPFGDGDYLFSVGNDPMRDFDTLAAASSDLPVRAILQTRKQVAVPAGCAVEIQDGWVTFEQLRERYAHARIVVVPLRPTVYAGGITGLLEAMSMGRPVIATRSQGLADYLEDGVTALLVPPGDASALRNAILRLLGDPGLARLLGENARRFCLEKCAVPIYADTVAGFIGKALKPS